MQELPLDDKTLRFIERNLAQIKTIQDQLQGALGLLIEQQGLEGNWQLDWAGKRLVRTDHAAAEIYHQAQPRAGQNADFNEAAAA